MKKDNKKSGGKGENRIDDQYNELSQIINSGRSSRMSDTD